MRVPVLIFAMLLLFGCSRPGWHMTDISGGMPKLDFQMTADGKPVTAQDYRGKVVALYFGYTHCPDVCPTTMANLTDMAAKVANPDLRILFVTVDPERDTDAVMADYEGLLAAGGGLARLAQCAGRLGAHLSRRL